MKSLLLFVLVTLLVICNKIQGQEISTRISGKFDKTNGRYLITLSKPVGSFYCAENIDLSDSIILQDEKFEVNCDLPLHSFVTLCFANHYVMTFYADSANDIKFEFLTDSAQNPRRVFFFGANAIANELLTNNELLAPFGNNKKEIEKIIIEAPGTEIALEKLQSVLKKYKDFLDELYESHKISRTCHDAFIAETEQRLLLCCKDILRRSALGDQLVSMSNYEVKKLINHLYTQYDPFEKRYFTAPSTINNITAKCILIHDGIIPPVIATPKDTWRSFSGEFMIIVPYFGVYDMAPNSLQLYLVGNALLRRLMSPTLTKEEFMEVYTTYRKRYPASEYNKLIDKKIRVTRFNEHSLRVPIIFTK